MFLKGPMSNFPQDLIGEEEAMLFLGPPGVGKTTLLRACAGSISENKVTWPLFSLRFLPGNSNPVSLI